MATPPTVLERHIQRSLTDAAVDCDPCIIEAACGFCEGDMSKLSVITGSDVSLKSVGQKIASVLRRTKSEPPTTVDDIVEPEDHSEPMEFELGNY